MNKTVLITGASGGIGLEFARIFARNGYSLVLVARSESKLKSLAEECRKNFGAEVKVVVLDLSKVESCFELYRLLEKENTPIDVLVNNAGFGLYGSFSETSLDKEQEMIRLNMQSLTVLTKLFLKGMKERKSGKILNVASTAAFQPGPLMSVYYATKAYVLSFSEALANELGGSGVTVTVLCPGPTETGFRDASNLQESKLFRGRTMSARRVAEIGYNGLAQGKSVVVTGLKNKIFAASVRFAPRWVVVKAVRLFQEKINK